MGAAAGFRGRVNLVKILTPRGFIRPRPIRVSYLVEDGEHSDVMLDAVFAECHTRWGGRYTLIVPCEHGEPRPAYMPWLEAYDPDIIYVYSDLDEAVIAGLHERFGPAFLLKHEPYDNGERDSRYFRPELPLNGLTSLSTAPQYTRTYPASAPQPMLVVDYGPSQINDRFVDDNFGTPYSGFGSWPLPSDLADALRSITLIPDESLRNPHLSLPLEGETVPDTVSLLRAMAEKRNSFGLAQLAADSTPRIEVRDRIRESFSLIIGDRFADRILFWNNRSLMPLHLGRAFATLIVSPLRLEDENFFAALAAFLNARNGVHPSQGTPLVELRSASVNADDLTALCKRFNASAGWNTFHVARPTTLDSAVPNTEALERAFDLVTGRTFDRSVPWREFPAGGNDIRPPAVLPDHLQGLQGLSSTTQGIWALDLDIERQNNLARAANVLHRWRLPRRLRMHGAFRPPYPDSTGRLRYSRTSREGYLSVFSGFGEEPPTISIPDDETAFRYGLELGHDWPPISRRDRGNPPSGPYRLIRPSDKGRYLIGALRLFGGLQEAGSALLHRYWKEVFEELGGAIATDRHDVIKRTLKKRLKTGTICDEDDWGRLAELVAREASHVRMPLQTLNFDELHNRHQPWIEKERKLLKEHHTENPEEWLDHAQASLPGSVKWLCSQSVLYQGYEWRCSTCFHRNWNPIQFLQSQMTCEVCGTSQITPVDKPWDFRLNGFLKEGLKEHGLLALFWCLVRLEERARETFFFLGPHDLFAEYPDNDRAAGDNEADLICIVDGKVHLCEVKSSARETQIDRLVNVAKMIRPDKVILAIFDTGSQRLNKKLGELTRALQGTGISAQLLTLGNDDLADSVDLPS